MELSLQVKGYLSETIARIFRWSKIASVATMAGVDASQINNQTFKDKRTASQHIIYNLPRDREERLIKVV